VVAANVAAWLCEGQPPMPDRKPLSVQMSPIA
jgi:hypothetical protein